MGLVGIKLGMSRFYNFKGFFIPVTLLNVSNNNIVYKKYFFNDGYNSICVTFGLKNIFNLRKSILKKFVNCNVFFGGLLKEFVVNNYDLYNNFLNNNVSLNNFYINQRIFVTGRSIGKGFSGVIKRYNFKSGTASHGNSKSHNSSGSIGMCQDPGRVFLGKKMAGHLGFNRVTISGLKILKIDFIFNVLFVSGSVPGFNGSSIFVSPVYLN